MNILLSFPTSPAHPYLHKRVVFVSWQLLRDRRHAVHPMIPTHSPFENNLHHIVKDFIDGNYDWWLSIDADNPPLKNPLDLVELDLDIVGCPTPVWHCDTKNMKPGERPLYWNAYGYVPSEGAYGEHKTKQGLQRVDAIGTGCFLVARRVFELPEMRLAPFQRIYNADGTVEKGNDIAFCERARACGLEIYAHYDYPCGHHVEVDLNEAVLGFRNLYEREPCNGTQGI